MAVSTDMLFDDVIKIQKSLQEIEAEELIDANVIFEKLETQIHLEDRVSVVLNQILQELGVPHKSKDAVLSPGNVELEGNEVKNPELSVIEISDDSDEETKNSSSKDNASESQLSCVVENQSSTKNLCNNENNDEVNCHPNAPLSKQSGCVDLSDSTSQSASPGVLLFDVNNNDPNNNTEFNAPGSSQPSSSAETEVTKLPAAEGSICDPVEVPDFSKEVIIVGDVSDGSRDAYQDIHEQLLQEARRIYHKIPQESFEEIYAYLEANIDAQNRYEVVLNEFLHRQKRFNDINLADEEYVDLTNSPRASQELHEHNQTVSVQLATGNPTDEGNPDSVSSDVTSGKRKPFSDNGSSPSKKAKVNDDEGSSTEAGSVEDLQCVQQENEVDKQLQLLWEMFPNIEPAYLQQRYANLQNSGTFQELISELLEHDSNSKLKDNDPLQLQEATVEVLEHGPDLSAWGIVDDPLHLDATATHPDRNLELDVDGENGDATPFFDMEEEEEEHIVEESLTDKQHEMLVQILPNVDPDYLREVCIKSNGNEDELKKIVTEILEGKACPTRKDAEKRKEIENIRSKFLQNFDIKAFLEVFPEPIKFFSDEKRIANKSYQEHVHAYLKGRYRCVPDKNITKSLKKHNYLLYPTVKELNAFKGRGNRRPRQDWDCRMPENVNIPFLHEVAFVENETKVSNYLKEKEERRRIAFEQAKVNNELLECGCCFDDECLVEEMAACRDGHLFCKSCVRSGAEEQIGQGKTVFPCLGPDCDAEFSLSTLQAVLKPTVFSRAVQRRQLEEVKAAGIEDLEMCPFCDFATILPQGDNVFKCQNPNCMQESCRLCKEPNHVPLKCNEVEKSSEIKMRTYIEDKMTEALVRTCWKCNKKFIKEEGCNKMMCPCGAMMCYICRQPVKDYSHFVGDGIPNAKGKCPLYSDNAFIHAEDVKKTAEMAKKEILAQNPDIELKHDPTKLLPKGPKQPKKLAHQFGLPHHVAEVLRVPIRMPQMPRMPPVPQMPILPPEPQMPILPPEPQMPRMPPVPQMPRMLPANVVIAAAMIQPGDLDQHLREVEQFLLQHGIQVPRVRNHVNPHAPVPAPQPGKLGPPQHPRGHV